MRFQGLDLNLLSALNALILDRSVTKAADRLHIGQPGMSAALAKLRVYFNDDLLVPVGRRLMLTPLAEQLAAPLQEVLADIERRILSQGQFDPVKAQQTFKFAMSDYMASMVLPDFIPKMGRLAPGMRFEIAPLSDRNDLDIERGEIDLIIIPSEFTSPHHPKQLLRKERWVCLCWQGNKLVGNEISEEDYFSLGHVATKFGRGQLPTHDERFLREQGMLRRIEVVVSGFNVIPEILVGSDRIATVPATLARKASRRLPLRVLELGVIIPPHETMIQWNSIKDNDVSFRWVKDRLVEVCNSDQAFREQRVTEVGEEHHQEPSIAL